MTASEMITKFRVMVDDTLDSDYELQLVNDAINEIESLRDWEILINETSYSGMTGYTDERALPTGFNQDISVWEDDETPYTKYSFADRYSKVNASFGYFLNMAENKIGLTGSSLSVGTIYLSYIKNSTKLTSTDTWAFPSRFHQIIPHQMAKLYYPTDAGEKNRAWDDRWDVIYNQLLSKMEVWDDRIKAKNYTPQNKATSELKINGVTR